MPVYALDNGVYTSLKFSDVISPENDSIPYKIHIILFFNSYFAHSFITADNRDNYTNLILGKRLNISEYPAETISDSYEINTIMNSLDSLKLTDISCPIYPNMNYSIISFIRKKFLFISPLSNFQSNKSEILNALLLFYYKSELQPRYVPLVGRELYCNGFSFYTYLEDKGQKHESYISKLIYSIYKPNPKYERIFM